MWKLLSLILFINIIFFLPNWGQTEMDKKLALNYYDMGDYEKANVYFEKIVTDDSPFSYYDQYFKSLIQTEDYKTAEKLTKKRLKDFPEVLLLNIYLAEVYNNSGKEDKAESLYKDAIAEIDKNTQAKEIIKLANEFERRNLLEYAIETYQKANDFSGSKSMYNRNIALIYGRQGKVEQMIEVLLDIIEEDERYYVSVQGALSNSIDFSDADSKEVNLLKTSLIKRIQNKPGKTIYNETLAWVYMLTKNYNGAYTQLKALDKKENTGGQRIMELGRTCINNREFEVAIQCFEYVIDMGKSSPFYREAKIYRVSALKERILSGASYTQEDLQELKNNYLQNLEQLGRNIYSLHSMRELAALEGYYLSNPEKGIEILEEALAFPGLRKNEQAQIKIDLGDLMVVAGNEWDASLLFMQVEKEFKEDKLGHEAKFKAAEVFYYNGDFDWAQAQLDVLKTSTSKLIANDAMELSMLITDNYNMDTTLRTMRLFAKADLLIKQHRYDEASANFDSIMNEFPVHTLNDEILLRKSEMALAQHKTQEAISFLEEIEKNYADDILADNAIFKLAQIYDYRLKDRETAADYYKKIMFEYQGSLFGVEARKRYRELKPSSNNTITPPKN